MPVPEKDEGVVYTYGHRPAFDFEGIDKKPPPQARSDRWGRFIEDTWNFRLFGEVKKEASLSFSDVMKLPKTISTIDMHYVMRKNV